MMDEEMNNKIEQLATNLKQNHLVASIEEAREKAKEILMTSSENKEKTVKDMMGETIKERITNVKKDLAEQKSRMEDIRKEITDIRNELIKENKEDLDDTKMLLKIKEELEKTEKCIQNIRLLAEEAEKTHN